MTVLNRLRSRSTLALAAALTALTGATLTACGGGDGGGIGGTGTRAGVGTLNVSITDAPTCGYDAVNVTVDRVRVHQSATAADSDSGWSEVILSTPRRLNLLTLTNGVLNNLGQTTLPAGTYQQVRLVLVDNSASAPLANSVVPTGGSETALDTPSAQQTGLKINLNLDVPADKVADLVLDFDACKSVVKRGNSGKYNLKPVVSATAVLSDAGQRVVGYVDTGLAGTAAVSVQQNGLPVKTTVPAADGSFNLYPVPAGTYDLVVSATGRATTVINIVPVTTTAVTTLNNAATALTPPVSTMRAVPGTVLPDTGSVRATQTLGNSSTVEVAWSTLTQTTGAFSLNLPLAAPQRATYTSGSLPAWGPFTVDTSVAGRYTIEATDGTTVKKSPVIDATAATLPTLAFTFP